MTSAEWAGEDSAPVIMVEMERWDCTVMFAVKNYSVVPNGGHPSLPDPEVKNHTCRPSSESLVPLEAPAMLTGRSALSHSLRPLSRRWVSIVRWSRSTAS